MTNNMLITLSIVSHGDAEKVRHLLSSLQRHESNTKQFQLILTDNLGNDLPEYKTDPWAFLHIIRNTKPQGFACNHNRAFEMAKGQYFAVLNPDLLFVNAIFDKLLSSLHSHNANLVAPQIIDTSRIIQDSARSLPTPIEIVRRRLPGYHFKSPEPDDDGLIHPDWIAAMFWVMPSDTYRMLDGMDEKFTLYFEDVDFCTRARIQDMKIIVDTKVQIQHDAKRSSRRNLYYFFLHMQSALRFFISPVYRQARKKQQITMQ